MIPILKLFRFPLIFTAVADSAAGYLLALGDRRVDFLTLGLLAVASGGLYCFGMAMNDIADRERDKTLNPNRVLPSGKLSLRGAIAAASMAAVISGAAIVAVSDGLPTRLGIWLTLVFLILTYDVLVKSVFVMGLVRAFNLYLGATAVPIAVTATAATGRPLAFCVLILFVYVTALTWVSTLEEGNRRKGVLACGAFLMAVAAASASLVGPFQKNVSAWGAVTAVPLIAWILMRAARSRDRKGVMLLVRDGVGGIILLDATFLLSSGLWMAGILVAGLVLPAALGVAIFKRA